MPRSGVKRARRNSYGGLSSSMTRFRGYGSPSTLLRSARMFGGVARGALASRIHTFKRMGTPMVFRSSAGLTLPTIISGAATSNTAGVSLGNLTAGATLSSLQFGGSLSFSLNQIANPSEITSLFDNYRIKSIRLKFIVSADSAQVPGSATGLLSYLPIMHFTIDPDDAAVPLTLTQVLENSYAKSIRLQDMVNLTVAPRANAVVAQNPSSTTAVASGILSPSQWLDCATPNVFHYGMKFWIDQWPGNIDVANMSVQIIPTYYIECRNVV